MTSPIHVHELWVYPVKSMQGCRAPVIELAELGVIMDRTWATRDEVRGGIRGAKKLPGLMMLRAEYVAADSRTVRINCPSGLHFTSDDSDADALLSRALNHNVTLWPLQPAHDLDHYRRGAPDTDDYESELRTAFGREDDEPLPNFSGFPPILEHFESPPGTYYDVHPLHILTTSALDALRIGLPESRIDVRRFRPSIVLSTQDPGHPEFNWVGSRIKLGDAILQVIGPCPRCVMVTQSLGPEVPKDSSILRYIVRELGQNLGVYATVLRPGRVSIGDLGVVA